MFVSKKISLAGKMVKPFALSKFCYEKDINIFTGKIAYYDNIEELMKSTNTFFCTPYRSIYDKYDIAPNNSKITGLKIEEMTKLEMDKHSKEIARLASEKLDISDLGYDCSNREFANKIESIIQEEIGNGSGTNFMLCRCLSGQINNLTVKKALGIFFRFVMYENGYYHTFCFFNGKDFIIGASPECHLKIHNRNVSFNRISGTISKNAIGNQKILDFLKDDKEINELFMAIDEDLKMMSKSCQEETKIIGPRLREMNQLIHTEYDFYGTSNSDNATLFKNSLCAATMLGSPARSALAVTDKHNKVDKSYYSGAIGIIDENGNIDSSIVMRSIFIGTNGKFSSFAGASIVKNSDPLKEILEINSKLQIIVNNLHLKTELTTCVLDNNCSYELELKNRNQKLNKFWFENYKKDKSLEKLNILIINNEDDFVFMFEKIVNHLGAKTQVLNWKEYKNTKGFDLVVIGPGPGNPNEINDKKIARLKKITEDLIKKSRQKFAGICLGHQMIAKEIGLEVAIGEKIRQGEQGLIDFFDKQEYVAFYNTFFAKYHNSCQVPIENIAFDKNNNEIFAIRDERFFSLQFHPESLLTQNGVEIIKDEISRLFNLKKVTDKKII